ncbi:transcriptional repressor [Bordetella genomosp. 10]|uniref:Ferric uptake regulation protein n=1 Tax=Bordetella genomosp. 10 TaxID=1416804 RepID=A0A261SBQ2_9BORD|nr:transcriptional repressor [Bordetella genomosp. 10]OZI34501.1 transcriptional repressor [Bordetella genomosp. 10]
MSDAVELKGIGLKVTFPRMKILDLFRNSEQRHLSAEDVYRLLINDGVEMGLATVYRVLTQFEHAGLLQRSQLGGNKAVYELNDGERHHGHLVSTTTGEVREFYDPQIEKRLQKIADEMGYTLTDHTITLFGAPK